MSRSDLVSIVALKNNDIIKITCEVGKICSKCIGTKLVPGNKLKIRE